MSTPNPRIKFQANFSCFIGSHAIVTGEEVSALKDVYGLYWLFCSSDEEPIAHLTADDVCKLAGWNIVKGE